MKQEIEHCCACEAATGRAGRGEDSLYSTQGYGPFCEDCWDVLMPEERGDDE